MSGRPESMEKRFVELETRLAFQEQTIEELHEVIYLQQNQMDKLTGELKSLHRRLQEALPDQQEIDDAHG